MLRRGLFVTETSAMETFAAEAFANEDFATEALRRRVLPTET